jgi:hypothetical protein
LILGVAALFLLLTALDSQIFAQSDAQLQVKIPFNFTICREQLPAGKYTLKHASTSNTHALAVRNADNTVVEIACTNDVQSPRSVEQGKLIFNRYGDQYFLAEAWWPGDDIGHQIVKSEREKTLIKELSGTGSKQSKKQERVIIKTGKPEKP